MAEPATGNAFLDQLLESAPPTVSQPKRGQNYNYPTRHYLKPDGTVVVLQGDPHNRAYYQDKGYHLLGDTPTRGGGKSEVEQFLEDEYPKVLAQQREKANIVNAIRRAGERYKDLSLEDTFDDYTVDELREYLRDIKADTGKDIRVVTPRRLRAAQETADKLLMGVETTASSSMERLQEHTRQQRRPPTDG